MGTTPLATQALLLTDSAFQSRATMAVLHTGSNIQFEDPSTPNHDSRVGLAGMAFDDPFNTLKRMYNYIIIQPAISAGAGNSSTISDQAILDAISAVWDQMADQLYKPPPVFTPPPLL